MALDDLKETIETMRERIEAHRAYLEGYETRTRQALIDPMLRALGWDAEDPDSVELEYGIERKRADYALMGSARPIAVIEAKRLGKPLDDDDTMQALNYANREGIDYTVVTNGDHWWMLEVFKRGRLEDRVLMEFRLTRGEPSACASLALRMAREGQLMMEALSRTESSTNQSVPSTPEPPPPAPSSRQEAVGPSNGGQDQDGWIPLTSLELKSKQKPPSDTIKFPDSSTKPLKNWADLLVGVAEHLVETGKILARDDLVTIGDSNGYIVFHPEPCPPTDTKFSGFRKPKEIGNGLWLMSRFDLPNIEKNAYSLLEQFDIPPSTVLIRDNRS